MSDIIRLLPDHVASQIAAGEVVQRPASAIKELLENSIDAGAKNIQLWVKDAGKALIQVIDDGKGMSYTDARMCFEHHATSKINKADDLFSLHTFGFRGEAMASIAAIAHVALKTRRAEDELGTEVIIEGSKVQNHEHTTTPLGTNILIKNLFYNIPARRNFLKSTNVEMRHVIEEFSRAALAHPTVSFSLHSEGVEQFKLTSGKIALRLNQLFGSNFQEKIVPIEENTPAIKISGYIGKPEYARKSREQQYFFVNGRYIKDSYLHHAISNAYQDLIAPDTSPAYFVYIDIDPKLIDVNVHPAKTQIKFEDDKLLYHILRTTAKRSLGMFSIAPSIDFQQDADYNNIPHFSTKTQGIPAEPVVRLTPNYNPFTPTANSSTLRQERNISNWETLFNQAKHTTDEEAPIATESTSQEIGKAFQLHNTYLVCPIKSGIMLIHQQTAHERILYEYFVTKQQEQLSTVQTGMFPMSIELGQADAVLLESLLPDFASFGFDIQAVNKTSYAIYGTPPEISESAAQKLILNLLDDCKDTQNFDKNKKQELIAKNMARNACIKTGKYLNVEEINSIIHDLFACAQPNIGINGKKTLITISFEELSSKF